MTDSIMALINYLRKEELTKDTDFLREAIAFLYQMLIDIEAEEVIGAGRYERTPGRQTHRNGSRERKLETRVAEITLKIPKLRSACDKAAKSSLVQSASGGSGAGMNAS
jgi:putative transposase